jgi:DNA-binding transcriptional MerR regulator
VLKADAQARPLPPIPAKRYFTIGEVSELCGVKPHVLRYWEQEFTQLKPVKRRGNRRYYQHHEVLLIRRIRELLYEQGFTISGARNRLESRADAKRGAIAADGPDGAVPTGLNGGWHAPAVVEAKPFAEIDVDQAKTLREELLAIAALLRS